MRKCTKFEGTLMYYEQLARYKAKKREAVVEKYMRVVGWSIIIGWFALTAVCYFLV